MQDLTRNEQPISGRMQNAGIKKFSVREINSTELETALQLALDVFMQFEAREFTRLGIDSYRWFLYLYRQNYLKGENQIWAAFINGEMAGMLGISGASHISLLFVRAEYQRLGIATALWQKLLTEVQKNHQELRQITLNASTYGLPFYKRIGFAAAGPVQHDNGAVSMPMVYDLKNAKQQSEIIFQITG